MCSAASRLAAFYCGVWLKNFAVFGKNGEINFAVFGKMLIFAHEKTCKKRRKYGVQTKTL